MENTMKILFDLALSLLGLLGASPLLAVILVWIWMTDWHSPFYMAPRVGKDGQMFRLVKLRSMRVEADASGVDSTARDDPRITRVGAIIRRYKLDELPQLWNVLTLKMSLVGPRPNVKRDTDLYTREEKRLLSVRPGITDIASIVFADEGEILEGKPDPDLAYNQLIRPWKSRLGLFYVDHWSLWLDLSLIWLTVVTLLSRKRALAGVGRLLRGLGAPEELRSVAERREPLVPHPPPGATEIVRSREVSPS